MTKYDASNHMDIIPKTPAPMKKITNRWLQMINWCIEHNIDYNKGFQWLDGMGHCDDTGEDTIWITTPEHEKLVLISRPTEDLGHEVYRITDCFKRLEQYRNDEYREDAKKIIGCKMAIECAKARLFQWGFTPDKADATELTKEFNLE